ncbi:unnamed protein product [Dicrocoelium dendriticum]|nr:unnamed protein product [Dicrocoelium dendriticum]CAH8494404.1 unnamed protein product [Dicrocoelium dendriticum]
MVHMRVPRQPLVSKTSGTSEKPKVSKNSLASRYGIEVGDVIVSICRLLTVGKTQEQLKAEILRAGNELDLVLIRRGIDLDKVSQCVPQVLTSSVRSPTQSTSPVNSNVSSPEAFLSYQSPIRGRSFRNVKTKSLRILEEQLAAGQPSSVLRTKQHFQGARGLPASGANTTFTTAYGQTSDQGYRGRMVNVQPTSTLGFQPNSTSVNIAPPLSPTNYAAYQSSQVLSRFGTSCDRPAYPSVANWDTQSDQSSYRTYQRSNSAGSGMQTSGVVHISPSQRDPQMATTAITVPIQRSQPRTDWAGSSYLRPNVM